jgi:hypothetical protein
MRGKAPSDAGSNGELAQLCADRRRRPRSSACRSVEDGEECANRHLGSVLEPGPKLLPAPVVLAAALEHAQASRAGVLLVQHSDRLARNDGKKARHLGEIYFWAIKADVELRSSPRRLDFHEFTPRVRYGRAQRRDSRRKSDAVRVGMHRAAHGRGQHMGGPRPYGYDYPRDDDGRIIPRRPFVVVRHEAAVVAGSSTSSSVAGSGGESSGIERGRRSHPARPQVGTVHDRGDPPQPALQKVRRRHAGTRQPGELVPRSTAERALRQ